MRVLITGGAGFIGSNVAAACLDEGCEVTVLDNLSRVGAEENLKWLRRKGDFQFIKADIRNRQSVISLLKRS